jgi:ubiquinone/menaquinone biosynthesis C-methylase UbiE
MSPNDKEVTTKEWYDFIGGMADVIPALHLGGERATRDLLEMCTITAETHVLDVGCGSGHTSSKIVKTYDCRVTGIDISETMVAKAKQRARKERLEDLVDFRVADIFNLPFEDDCFDVALFESVLTPLPGDKLKALLEAVRVIRPGGLVAVNESLAHSSATEELFRLAEEHPAIHGLFNPETLRSLLEGAGLEIVEMSDVIKSQAPSMTKALGLSGMISFFFRSYPSILWKLITDSRFRRAARVDDKLTKLLREQGGYILIVGRVLK